MFGQGNPNPMDQKIMVICRPERAGGKAESGFPFRSHAEIFWSLALLSTSNQEPYFILIARSNRKLVQGISQSLVSIRHLFRLLHRRPTDKFDYNNNL